MALKIKNTYRFFFLQTILLAIALPNVLFSQTSINGRVVYQSDNTPAAYASIELNGHQASTMSDKSGNFRLHVPAAVSNDTMIISSVGYETIRMPVAAALKKTEYKLKSTVKNMETVTVFNKHQTVGLMSESVGYFRSWSYNNTGGEIGRIFKLPSKKYKIDKVRFKVANFCDTCLLRLRFREVVNGRPGNEIISDSISMYVNRLTLADKVPEFDLTDYDFTFNQDQLFVSIEVLGCSSKQKQFCSFSFAGTDEGDYIYKSKGHYEWEKTEDYAIFLRLFFRY